MMAVNLRVGDLVWAKMKGFPAWPARVIEPERPPPSKRFHHNVLFFGTKDHAWIPDENIAHHTNEMLDAPPTPKKIPPTLRAAMEEIREAAKDYITKDDPLYPFVGKLVDARGNELTIQEKLTAKYQRLKKIAMPLAKRRLLANKQNYLIRKKKPRAVIQPYDDEPKAKRFAEPGARLKKIGFLGLGPMGHRMVANLLGSGHRVTVWNRTPERCDALVREGGALRGKSPADVVMASDITICCVSDPAASRGVVFLKGGVLEGLGNSRRGSKGFVEMTALDGQTSREIGEAVTFAGGRYLECPFTGTCQLGETGDLTLYCSGDIDLYQECSDSVFHAIGQTCSFISNEAGAGSNVNLIHSMALGTVCAAFGEAMAMADRMAIPKNTLLDVLDHVGLTASFFRDKAKAMVDRHAPACMPLRNQQQHIDLALTLGPCQPMPVTAAANELYKHAKRLGYSKKDSGAVFLATKF